MSKSLTIQQIAVLATCEAINVKDGYAPYWRVPARYATGTEIQELIDRKLIVLNEDQSMSVTTVGKCYLLNLSKQPVY